MEEHIFQIPPPGLDLQPCSQQRENQQDYYLQHQQVLRIGQARQRQRNQIAGESAQANKAAAAIYPGRREGLFG